MSRCWWGSFPLPGVDWLWVLERDDRKWGREATHTHAVHIHTEQMMCWGAQTENCPWEANIPELLGGSVARCFALPACLGFGPSVPLQAASITLRHKAHMPQDATTPSLVHDRFMCLFVSVKITLPKNVILNTKLLEFNTRLKKKPKNQLLQHSFNLVLSGRISRREVRMGWAATD